MNFFLYKYFFRHDGVIAQPTFFHLWDREFSLYKEFFSFFFFFLLIKTGSQFLKFMPSFRRRRYSRAFRRNRRYRRRRRTRRFNSFRRVRPLAFRSTGRRDTTQTKLVYSDIFSLNPAGGAAAYQVFNANSLFDPDKTGVGHQPRGFDELSALYHRYRVLASKMSIVVSNSTATPVTVCVGRKNDSVTFATLSDVLEFPTTRWKIVNSNSAGVKLRVGFVGTKQFGRRYLTDDFFQAQITASPTEAPEFFVYCFASDGTSDPGAIDFTVRIEYYCKFTESLMVPQS